MLSQSATVLNTVSKWSVYWSNIMCFKILIKPSSISAISSSNKRDLNPFFLNHWVAKGTHTFPWTPPFFCWFVYRINVLLMIYAHLKCFFSTHILVLVSVHLYKRYCFKMIRMVASKYSRPVLRWILTPPKQ